MATTFPPPPIAVLLLLLLLVATDSTVSSALSLPFNSSFPPPPPPRTFLGDLARALAAKQGWDPEAEIRVADLEEGGSRVAFGQRYEFRLRIGRRALNLKFYDEGIEWRKVDGAVVELRSGRPSGTWNCWGCSN